MSEIQETRATVKEFLADLENKSLIKFPNLELTQIFKESEHRAEIDVLKEGALTRIKLRHDKEKEAFIPDSEWIALNKKETLNQMRENSEELKTYLKAIIDPKKINPEVNELGTYLKSIYITLDYDKPKRQNMNNVFFKDFRNALSHLDYDISLDSITWRDRERTTTTWDNDFLLTVMLQMGVTIEEINNKVEEIKLRE